MKTIVSEVKNRIGFIRFNRPEVRNAFNIEMMEEFHEQLMKWKEDDNIRVLVLTGNDNKAFVSGGDVEQLHQFKTKEAIEPVLKKMAEILMDLDDWGKPSIAMINGFAIGGGCELATACDFRFASNVAKLGFVQINIGITTGWGGGTRLIRLLGRAKALQLLLTGARMDAEDALEIGFVDRLYAADELEEQTLKYAEMLASKNPSVVTQYLEMAKAAEIYSSEKEMILSEVRRCAELWEKEEHLQAVETFLKETRKG